MLSFSAPVTHGHKIAQKFGIATANLDLDGLDLEPDLEFGVYFVLANKIPALLHFGPRKTFGSDVSAEVHILDFEDDLYGKNLEIEVLKKLRDIQKFQNADALYTQIEKDIIQARKYFLRREIKNLWNDVSEAQRHAMAAEATQKISEQDFFQKAEEVLVYEPMKDEVPFTPLLQKKFPEKQYWFPESLEGALQCAPTKSLIIVPGLAADLAGKRLGRGGGFYDQLLAQYSDIPTLMILPKFALREMIPVERHDRIIDEVIVCTSG